MASDVFAVILGECFLCYRIYTSLCFNRIFYVSVKIFSWYSICVCDSASLFLFIDSRSIDNITRVGCMAILVYNYLKGTRHGLLISWKNVLNIFLNRRFGPAIFNEQRNFSKFTPLARNWQEKYEIWHSLWML